ncbi:MAG: flagellar biosynthesis protein FliQ [Candidatus Binatia bacterium]|nr:flagellar biosynthesis protein FliQ [Candidatus Binatia bacterium]
MTPETVLDVLRGALEVGMAVSGPILLTSLLAGVAVSIVQAATQINDQTLVFVPKMLAAAVVLVLCGTWMMQLYIDFTRAVLLRLPTLPG